MSYQQNQQKCQLPAKCLPKYPPKWPPRAPAPCPAPCAPAAPSCCVPSCCLSGFGACCSLVSHRFPGVCLGRPQPALCCEREPSGCSACCHGLGNCH